MAYQFNSGKRTRLSALIKDGSITDETTIKVYNSQTGRCLAAGNWFQDWVLDYSEKFGHANSVGGGAIVRFWLD